MDHNLFNLNESGQGNVIVLTELENEKVYDLLNDKLYQANSLEPAELACLDPYILDYKILYKAYTEIIKKDSSLENYDEYTSSSVPYITDILALECSRTQAIHLLSKGLHPQNLPTEEKELIQKWLDSYQSVYEKYQELVGQNSISSQKLEG